MRQNVFVSGTWLIGVHVSYSFIVGLVLRECQGREHERRGRRIHSPTSAMKFAQYLSALERDAPQEWQGRFIQYKKLKKMLKACLVADERDREEGGDPDEDERSYTVDKDREGEFFGELETELQAVNKHFFDKADRTVMRYQRRTRGVLAFVLKPVFALNAEQSLNQLARDAYWCRKYARANAVALRKILKKHDKTCGNRRGRVFLQECWALSSPDGIGLFLHSPLLDELKAVQEKLQMSLDSVGSVVDPNADRNEVYPLRPEEQAASDEYRRIVEGTSLSASKRRLSLEERAEGEVRDGGNQDFGICDEQCDRAVDRDDDGGEADDEGEILDENHRARKRWEGRKNMARSSVDRQSSPESVVLENPASVTEDCTTAYTHSIDASRRDALLAIEQATTCLLDSSDIDWEDDTPLHSGDDTDTPNWPEPAEGGTFVEGPSADWTDGKSKRGDKDKSQKKSLGKETYKRGVDPDTLGFSPNKGSAVVSDVRSSDKAAEGEDGGDEASRRVSLQKSNTHPAGSNNESSMAGASATYDEGDFTCPICLELMYRPVGLSCGHKFCRQCALDAAGFGKVFGAFRNIISYIPARITCPECRQAKAYKGAVSLKELGFLIRDRYPKEYAARRDDEREHRRNVAARSTPPPTDPSRPFYPFDLLHI